MFFYPNQGVATVNQLVIPAGQPIHLKLTSATVMQSFLVPKLAGQIYARGMQTQLYMQADTPSRFWGENTQFNGLHFQSQKFAVDVLSRDAFKRWIADTHTQPNRLDADPRRRFTVYWLLSTWILGVAFLGMEVNDFATMAREGAVADQSFFLSAYTVLVGTHGLHVLVATIWLFVMLLQIATLRLDRPVRINLVRLSLYWHFLDIVWVGIFSVVYLQGALR